MSAEKVKLSRVAISEGFEIVGHVGGIPVLSNGLEQSKCKICGSVMTFYFMTTFPDWHNWFGKAVYLYACTSCDHAGDEIPRIYTGDGSSLLDGITLPDLYLQSYQTSFAVEVHNLKDPSDFRWIEGKVSHLYLVKSKVRRLSKDDCGFAMKPAWRGKSEAPGYFEREGMEFLFQIKPNVKYNITADAPLQARKTIHPSLSPFRSERNYTLFVENALYFFGNSISKDSVYIISQRP